MRKFFESETRLTDAVNESNIVYFLSCCSLKHRLRQRADSLLYFNNDVSLDSFGQQTIQAEHPSRCNLIRGCDCNIIFSWYVSASFVDKKKNCEKFHRM